MVCGGLLNLNEKMHNQTLEHIRASVLCSTVVLKLHFVHLLSNAASSGFYLVFAQSQNIGNTMFVLGWPSRAKLIYTMYISSNRSPPLVLCVVFQALSLLVFYTGAGLLHWKRFEV